jgi:hypothetical protein
MARHKDVQAWHAKTFTSRTFFNRYIFKLIKSVLHTSYYWLLHLILMQMAIIMI